MRNRGERISIYWVGSLLLAASGCGGGGGEGGGGGGSEGPLPTSEVKVTGMAPPDGASGVAIDSVIQATFSQPLNDATLSPATFQLLLSDSQQVAGSVGYDPATRTATFQPAEKLGSESIYLASLTGEVEDEQGKKISPVAWSFTTVDALSPKVLGFSPACGTINVSPSGSFCVDFSEPVDADSVDPSTFHLSTPFVDPVPVKLSLSADKRSICLTPESALPTDTAVGLHLGSEIKDLSGNPLASAPACSFVTVETVKPFVAGKSPKPGEEKVPVGSPVTVEFSEPLVAGAVHAGTVSLKKVSAAGALSPVPGTLSYDPASLVATIQHAKKFSYSSTYQVKVSGTIQDIAGNSIGADDVWTFSTPSGWADPALFETDDANAANPPRIAVHPATGTVYAVWHQRMTGDNYTNIYLRSRLPGQDWGPQVRISDPTYPKPAGAQFNVLNATNPVLAVAPDGTVTVLWVQKAWDSAASSYDSIKNVYSSYLAPGATAWTAPVRVSVDNSISGNAASDLRIAAEAGGRFHAIWLQKTNDAGGNPKATRSVLHSTLLLPSTAWSAPVEVNSDFKNDPANPSLGVSASSGAALALFEQQAEGDPKKGVYSSLFDPLAGAWAAQVSVNTEKGSDVSASQLALDRATGQAFAIWIQTDPGSGKMDVFARAYDPAAGAWQLAQTNLSQSASGTDSPQIGVSSSNGIVFAVWNEAGSAGNSSIVARQSGDGGATWSAKAALSGGSGLCTFPGLGIEGTTGSALVVWVQPNNGKNRVHSNQFLKGQGPWDAEPKLASQAPGDTDTDSDSPVTATYFQEEVLGTVAVWLQVPASGAKKNLWTNLLLQ